MNTCSDADIQSALRLNPNPPNYQVFEVAVKSSGVAIQASATIVFIIIYYHMNFENLNPHPVLFTTLLTSLLGYVIYQLLFPTSGSIKKTLFGKLASLNVPREHVRVAVVYLLFSYLLAPTLRTLTDTISTDTIHVTAACMFGSHLITFDYGMKGFMVSKTISLNAAIIGSIFLASRLDTEWHSIALLTFAVQSFILFPIFSTLIQEVTYAVALIIIVSAAVSYTVSSNAFLAYACLMFILVILGPVTFVISCGLKRNIYGPWDEATPDINKLD